MNTCIYCNTELVRKKGDCGRPKTKYCNSKCKYSQEKNLRECACGEVYEQGTERKHAGTCLTCYRVLYVYNNATD